MNLDLTPRWLDNLLDINNPFVPWLLLIDLFLLLLHIYLVYWVYRDALWRYNRGAPWGLLTALLPFAGWLFYLMYRRSPLVAFDRIDAETFDDSEHQWTDYDTFSRKRSQAWFGELMESGKSYSPWVQLSRAREQRRKLTPEELRDAKTLRRQRRADARIARAARKSELRERRKANKLARKERQTMTAAHGHSYRMSDRRQRQIKQRLAVMEQLKAMPREDAALEQLIYEMEYQRALDQAREGLEVADEMNDAQGIATYSAYIERLEGLVDR